MLDDLRIVDARIVLPDGIITGDVAVRAGRIRAMKDCGDVPAKTTIRAEGKLLLPGLIDPHVHLREPGLTHKGDMQSETAAALFGGVTTVLDMPNTKPPTVSQESLDDKKQRARGRVHTNIGFWLGATAQNLDTLASVRGAVGVKLYMGSTTGDMLVDDEKTLDKLFSLGHHIAVHAEDETIIRERLAQGRERWSDTFPLDQHAWLRPAQACVQAAKRAITLAQRHGTRLHLCHLSCQEELKLLDGKVTSEVCLPHLWFTQENPLGTRAKINPAIKTLEDRTALRVALANGQIDCLATDHAPHLASEKDQPYLNAPSGLPSLECVLPLMLDLMHQGVLDLPTLVQRACVAPAQIFGLTDRGHIAEGFHADLVLCDPAATTEVATIRSKAAWSPWTGTRFHGRVETVIVGGQIALQNTTLNPAHGTVLSM